MRTPQRHQARDSGFLARQARVKRGTLAAAARADDRLGRRSAAGTPSAPGCCGSARLRAFTFIRILGARQRGALPGQVAGQRPGPVQHCRDLIGAIGLHPGAGRRDRPPHPSSTGSSSSPGTVPATAPARPRRRSPRATFRSGGRPRQAGHPFRQPRCRKSAAPPGRHHSLSFPAAPASQTACQPRRRSAAYPRRLAKSG